MSEEMLTVSEAAEKLSVSPRTIQRYCKQGRLNYKWIKGKRHKELRIIPPIPISTLPGVHHKADIQEMGFASSVELEELKYRLEEKDERIESLEREIAAFKSLLESSPDSVTASGGGAADDQREIIEQARAIVSDFKRIRPVEQKLILKMAKEIKAHGDFLATLGMKKDGDGD